MNIKKIVISFILISAFIISPAIAKTIEIRPKDVPNCENFTPRELKLMQKDVDEGHQPWRSDPVTYAKLFMENYYPKLDPNKMETMPAKTALNGNNAIVKIIHNNKEHVTYLHKAFPSNKESIWIVDKMIIKDIK